MSAKEDFEHVSLHNREAIIKYLTALKEGFENGQIILSGHGNHLVLEPKDLFKMEVKAKRKKDETKMSLKLSWKEEKIKGIFNDEPLNISSNNPS